MLQQAVMAAGSDERAPPQPVWRHWCHVGLRTEWQLWVTMTVKSESECNPVHWVSRPLQPASQLPLHPPSLCHQGDLGAGGTLERHRLPHKVENCPGPNIGLCVLPARFLTKRHGRGRSTGSLVSEWKSQTCFRFHLHVKSRLTEPGSS